jgi:hypothetical protein
MLLYPRHYMRFLDGRGPESAVVGFLPGDLAARMPTLSTDVRIGRENAAKIWSKHRLGYWELSIIQQAIDHGWCAKSRSSSLDFLYVNPEGRRYLLGLKAAYGGQETWVTTLYPTKEAKVRKRLREANAAGLLIRSHDWGE